MATANIVYNSKPYPLKTASVAVAKDGTITVVAAVAGKSIALLGYLAHGGMSITWKSNTTALSGAQVYLATAPVSIWGPSRNGCPQPFFLTETGEALIAREGNVNTGNLTVFYAEVDP